MLTDAELLLGMRRHLSAFSVNPTIAQLDSLVHAGKLYELAWCLRGSGASTVARVNAIAVEASITPRELHAQILPALEQLGWLEKQILSDGSVSAIVETVPPASELLQLASSVLDICMPSKMELAALSIFRSTTLQPLERNALTDHIVKEIDCDEQSVNQAVSALSAVNLIRVVTDDSSREVVFNPNVWTGDAEITRAALRAEDAKVSLEIGALLQEVSERQGMPEAHVESTEPRWIDFAVSQGLVQRSVVQTAEAMEQRFLFTPHLQRDPFGGPMSDPSGHARQLVGSMVYAATFAHYKLYSPAAFVRTLIRDGEAGDASPIGTDYPMLETAGIVRVISGSTGDRFTLQLLQADVAEQALSILNEHTSASSSITINRSGLRGQRSYVHVEKERARLAKDAEVDDEHRRRLITALRETSARRAFNG